MRCIGATTLAEFKKYIESDAALERRVPIDLRQIIRGRFHKNSHGIKSNYENTNLKITDKVIAQAVRLPTAYHQQIFGQKP